MSWVLMRGASVRRGILLNRRFLTRVLPVTLAVGVLVGLLWKPVIWPEIVLFDFYYLGNTPECMITQPLEAAGSAVVPSLLRDLPSASQPRRRYVIGFLREGRYREALPALEVILNDPTERDYFRGDALLAISNIDLARAQQLSTGFSDATGNLKFIRDAVIEGGPKLYRLMRHDCG